MLWLVHFYVCIRLRLDMLLFLKTFFLIYTRMCVFTFLPRNSQTCHPYSHTHTHTHKYREKKIEIWKINHRKGNCFTANDASAFSCLKNSSKIADNAWNNSNTKKKKKNHQKTKHQKRKRKKDLQLRTKWVLMIPIHFVLLKKGDVHSTN